MQKVEDGEGLNLLEAGGGYYGWLKIWLLMDELGGGNIVTWSH